MPNDQTPKVEDINVISEPAKPLEGQGKDAPKVEAPPAPESELEKAIKKQANLERDNKKQRDEIAAYKEAQKLAEEKALKDLGKWEELAKTKDEEIQTQFKPALEGLKAENDRLKAVVASLLEGELAKLNNQTKENFNKLFSEVSDPIERLDKLRKFLSTIPNQQASTYANPGQPLSTAGNSTAEQNRNIHKYGNQQQKAALYGQIAQKMDGSF